jgi:acyl dehydratase
MALNLDLVGKASDPITHTYSWRDTVLYALGVGAKTPDELDVLFEMNGPKVLPTFAVVPSFTAMLQVCGKLGANMAMVVHGEQSIRLHRPIAPNGTLQTVAVVTGIYDKGKGAVAVVEAKTVDDAGHPVFDNIFSIFVRGAGGFGGDRGPETVTVEPPDRAPDFAITERTSAEQAALYRLSGDLNPLHISPSMAQAVGFERPILHGLCTYGFAGRAIVRAVCGGDTSKLRSFAARFSAPVLPGDELTTSGWRNADGSYLIRVTAGEGDARKTVLSNARVEIG